MQKTRLEAFSDGVIAIIITIMVLELKVPHGSKLEDLAPLFPNFMSYILSFIYIGIYWNNHHHMLHAVQKSKRKCIMDKRPPFILAVLSSFCYRVDGGKQLYNNSGCLIWFCLNDGGYRLLFFSPLPY